MHIPSSMLNGAVCPVTLAVGAAGTAAALYFAKRQTESPTPAKFAAVTAMIFAMQMLNFPILNGTSGHLLGGMMAVALLGVPFAVLSIALVLAVQAVFFADGGVNAIGANVLNMSFLGAAAAGAVFHMLQKTGMSRMMSLALASWLSVVLAAAACAVEVALSGAVGLSKALSAMLSVHALIGMAEAVLTVAVVAVLSRIAQAWQKKEGAVALASLGIAVMSAMLSPFASSFPDGLEWVAGRLSFAEFRAFEVSVLFPDYQAGFVSSAAGSTILAGMAGVVIVLSVSFVLARSLKMGSAVRSI